MWRKCLIESKVKELKFSTISLNFLLIRTTKLYVSILNIIYYIFDLFLLVGFGSVYIHICCIKNYKAFLWIQTICTFRTPLFQIHIHICYTPLYNVTVFVPEYSPSSKSLAIAMQWSNTIFLHRPHYSHSHLFLCTQIIWTLRSPLVSNLYSHLMQLNQY